MALGMLEALAGKARQVALRDGEVSSWWVAFVALAHEDYLVATGVDREEARAVVDECIKRAFAVRDPEN